MISVPRPGVASLDIYHVVFDLNGTLAEGGQIPPQVIQEISTLQDIIELEVLTAATYGGLEQLKGILPCRITQIDDGVDKLKRVQALGPGVMAVGNGANDAMMLKAADIGICVMGAEGAAGVAIQAADIIVSDILHVFALLKNPQRLTETLRS